MTDICDELRDAEVKAWKALARYKFILFGYYSAIWVSLNRIEGKKRANPFKSLVELANESVNYDKTCRKKL